MTGEAALDPEREVQRVLARVRFDAFRALRVVATTLGVLNLVLSAIQYNVTSSVTPGLRAIGIAQLAVVASGWLFNERTQRAALRAHVASVALLAVLTVHTLGFTAGAVGLMIWLSISGGIFYGLRGALIALASVTALLVSLDLRIAFAAVPPPTWGTAFPEVGLAIRWSLATLTISGVLIGAVVAVVRGLETATREMSNALVREKTAREAQAKGIEALNRARQLETAGRLVGGVAHDLNNLLTPIVTYGNLLVEQHPNNADVVEAARGIVNAANDAASLTHQLLAFSRPGTQARVPVDLHALLDATFTLMRRTLSKNIAIELSLSSPRFTVLGDATLLRNAFANLAMNARDAMPQGGTLAISTLQTKQTIEVAVRDTGAGMSAEVQARLFEPFFSTKPDGNGLGLAAVYGTVQNHTATIEVTTAIGQGTTFRLRFPLIENKPLPLPAVARPAHPGLSAETARGKVLVVDDEALVRKVIVKFLSRRGFECHEAPDGRAGLDVYEAQKDNIALLVLDSEMPRLSGREMLMQVRLTDPDLPVLMVTGYMKDVVGFDVTKDPSLRMLAKPFDPDELLAQVNQLLAARVKR